jgi:protein-tyrosine phosphatase
MSKQPSSDNDLERRVIRLPGTSNLRDLGGYPGADGRSVRWGRLYRSGAMPRLERADWHWMHERQIAVVCDLRSAAERELAPTRWQGPKHTRHVQADYDAALIYGRRFTPPRPGAAVNDLHQSLYALFVDILAPTFREIIAALLDEQAPIIFHCSAGQDRTGLTAGLLLSLLGVDRDIIYADYLLSTQCRQFENELDRTGVAEFAETNIVARFFTDAIRENGINSVRPPRLVDGSGNALLKLAFDEIEGRFGSVGEYARQRLDLEPKDIERFRELYLEPPA